MKKGGWSNVEEPGKVTHDLDYDDSTDLHETRENSFRKYETRGYLDHGSFAQASLDTPLPDDNRGMKLLYKMGWKKDTSLDRDGTGTPRVDSAHHSVYECIGLTYFAGV